MPQHWHFIRSVPPLSATTQRSVKHPVGVAFERLECEDVSVLAASGLVAPAGKSPSGCKARKRYRLLDISTNRSHGGIEYAAGS